MPPRQFNNRKNQASQQRRGSATRRITIIAAIGVAAATAFPAPAQARTIAPELGPLFATVKAEPKGPFVPVVGKVDYGTAENGFGAARSGHTHAGHDMFAPAGTPEIAVTDTVVLETGADGGQGNYVYLYDVKRDRTYVYMHMIAPPIVKQGEKVEAGQRLGALGCTGSCWGDHLHFEIRDGRGYEAMARDPLPLLKEWRTLKKPL